MSQPEASPMAIEDERQARRRASQGHFETLAQDYRDTDDVSRSMMFGSCGLRVHGKFFAFVGGAGELIIKLPAVRASELVTSGVATPVRIGRHATREWVAVVAEEPHRGHWAALIAAAHEYVRSLTSAP